MTEPRAKIGLALQPALAVRGELLPCRIDRGPEIDAAQDVVELPRVGTRVAHVVRDDRRDAELRGELRPRVAAIDVGGPPTVHELGVRAVAEDLAEPDERLGVVGLRERDEPRRLAGDERERRARLRLLAGQLRGGHDPAEARPAGAVHREERHRIGIDEPQLHPEDRLDPARAGRVPEPDRAVQPVRVGERERILPVRGRGVEQIVDARCAIQEAVVALRVEMNESARHLATIS